MSQILNGGADKGGGHAGHPNQRGAVIEARTPHMDYRRATLIATPRLLANDDRRRGRTEPRLLHLCARSR